jgi:hypothetical protein
MSDHLGGQEFIAGIGRAATCTCYKKHTPGALRFVWHHILPAACGGKPTVDNLVEVCDNCHYAIHALLYDLKVNNGKFVRYVKFAKTSRGKYATMGWLAAVALGTQDKIPSEGSAG